MRYLRRLKYCHPFLFAFVSVIKLYNKTSVIASPDQTIRTLLIFWGILALLSLPFYRLTKDRNWTASLLSAFSVLFFSSPEVFWEIILLVGVTLTYRFLYSLIKNQPFGFANIPATLLGSAMLLIASSVLNIWSSSSFVSYWESPYYTWNSWAADDDSIDADIKPDVYYIVLDGYGRADILKDYYGYDNSDFTAHLQERGFIVPTQSRSNYPKTALSISSTLNMDYISNIVPELQGESTSYWWLLKPVIRNSRVRAIFEEMGYRSYSVTTGWGITDNPTTDVYLKPSPVIVNDFEAYILNSTPLRTAVPFISGFAYVPSYDDHRNLALHNFSSLSAAVNDENPKFVFAHIVLPHPPFVFGENGEPLVPIYDYSFNDANNINLSDEEYRKGYIAQMKFINGKINELVDVILANSKIPPIIILQADHGPGMMTDFTSRDDTCLRERFSIFAAYYIPNVEAGAIPEDITPVNVFRVIFNKYFEANYPLLDNHQYFHQGDINIFRVEDVTMFVDTCSSINPGLGR